MAYEKKYTDVTPEVSLVSNETIYLDVEPNIVS